MASFICNYTELYSLLQEYFTRLQTLCFPYTGSLYSVHEQNKYSVKQCRQLGQSSLLFQLIYQVTEVWGCKVHVFDDEVIRSTIMTTYVTVMTLFWVDALLKFWSVHGTTCQKIIIFILAAVRM
jgi:hypothetical protein